MKEQSVKEAQGFDKEAYEYSISPRFATLSRGASSTSTQSRTYLLKLEYPLDSPIMLQAVMQWQCAPRLIPGVDDDGELVYFCSFSSQQRAEIMENMLNSSHLTFLPITTARKELSSFSRYPTLGLDSTMPQNRQDKELILPMDNTYPVYYFFYGTLAQPDVLNRVLGRPSDSSVLYKAARIYGGRLTKWANKYLGIVDSAAIDAVDGYAYLVESQNDEEALRIYETSKYEVVRCTIKFKEDGSVVPGLTFRIMGE